MDWDIILLYKLTLRVMKEEQEQNEEMAKLRKEREKENQ
jgi:hypothetical protein